MSKSFSVGIMQPYFFPYWGHFALIAQTQKWVVFDVTQYTPKTWMNRNRILHPTQGWQYIHAPVKNASISNKTHEIELVNRQACGEQLLRQIMHYKKRAPFYPQVCEVIRHGFGLSNATSLVDLNVSCLQSVCEYLDVSWQPQICSQMSLEFAPTMQAGDWAPTIASQMGAQSYINPINGQELFDPHQFLALGVDLCFLQTNAWTYDTKGYSFEPSLSMIDVMMWLSPQEIHSALFKHSHVLGSSVST